MSNGAQLFLQPVDGRSVQGRRFRDIMAEVISDLGGNDGMSEGQRQLVRRVAGMSVACELMELDMALGKQIDMGQYSTASNTLRRLLDTIGLKRQARDTAPTLEAYLRDKYGAQETAE